MPIIETACALSAHCSFLAHTYYHAYEHEGNRLRAGAKVTECAHAACQGKRMRVLRAPMHVLHVMMREMHVMMREMHVMRCEMHVIMMREMHVMTN